MLDRGLWKLVLVTSVLWQSCQSSSAISLAWNTTYAFGPDGPWNAISIGLQNPITSQKETVSLIPANRFVYSWIPTTEACSNDADFNCADGGTLAWPVDDDPAGLNRSRAAGNWSYVLNGNIESVSLSFGNQVVPSATVVAFNSSKFTYPSGQVRGAELGVFYLGGQTIGGGPSNVSCANSDCNPTLFLYNEGIIPSYSHGLTFGSAALGFPGSLVVGGFDSGRVIGPVLISEQQGTTLSYFVQPLLDVRLGVETGGSPLPSDAVTSGLLRIGDQPATQPIPMTVDSQTPYIFLPSGTIEALISLGKLPIYFDPQSKYYLWDTENPLYVPIVTSPTYLAFIFSVTTDSSSDYSNITIKVPFILLNLTLEASVSGLDKDVAYFPVQPDDLADSTNPFIFGRAFLQAAFWGKSWNQNCSWLAQAAGPGPDRQGLGYLPQDIMPSQTVLSAPTGANLFNDSWAGHWTPLPANGSSSDISGDNNSSSDHSSMLSVGAIAGIAIGGVAVFALVILGILLLIRRQRKRTQALSETQADEQVHAHQPTETSRSTSSAVPVQAHENWQAGLHPVMRQHAKADRYDAPEYVAHELSPDQRPSELSTHTYPQELPTKRWSDYREPSG